MKRQPLIIFILDRAHGINVSGKQSPDGSFKEWEYSDRFVNDLAREAMKLKIPFAFTCRDDKEPGLTNRVQRGNFYAMGYDIPIFLSFHNNGGGGTGMELYTSPGFDQSDIVAEIIAKRLIADFPELRFRRGSATELDKEAEFTVIAGNQKVEPEYLGVLLEFLFMDNENDLKLLKDESIYNRYLEAILMAMVEICKHFNVGNFLIPEE